MGHVEVFPNTTVYLQAAELTWWMRTMTLPKRLAWLWVGADPADFHHLFERSVAGQDSIIVETPLERFS